MINVADCILYLYPGSIPKRDFEIIKHDNGVESILIWNLPDPQPTLLELESVWIPVMKRNKIKELNMSCNLEILNGFNSLSTGHFFEFGTLDQDNMSQEHSRLMRREDVLEVRWNTVDAGEMIFTRDQFFVICDEAAEFKWNRVFRYRDLKSQVLTIPDTGITVEEAELQINSISW